MSTESRRMNALENNVPLSTIIFFQIKFKIVLSFKAIPLFHKRLHHLKVPPALFLLHLIPLISTCYINGCVAEQKGLLMWNPVAWVQLQALPYIFSLNSGR